MDKQTDFEDGEIPDTEPITAKLNDIKVDNNYSTESSLSSKRTIEDSKEGSARKKRKETPKKDDSSLIHKDIKHNFQKALFVGCAVLDTSYEILKKIGEGTFGEVSKAKHKISGEIFALKKILIHNDREGIPITALREIKILKSLKHENIINLSEMAFEHGDRTSRGRGTIYMVFPFLDHDLTGLLENPNVHLKQGQIKSYIQQLLRGTKYLHDQKILHRDMKCSNILIDNRGYLKLADFGLARIYTPEKEERQYTNNVVTRWYRPPELFLGQTQYNGSVDMWGVGCVIGELFKRRPILPGSTDLNQLDCIFGLFGTPTESEWPGFIELPTFKDCIESFNEMKPRILRDAFQKYDPLAVDLIDRIMRYNPKDRFTAAKALEHIYFTSDPKVAVPNTSDFSDVYASSHEYGSRIARKENTEMMKHVQGVQAPLKPKSHYADPDIIKRFSGYNSLDIEKKDIQMQEAMRIDRERNNANRKQYVWDTFRKTNASWDLYHDRHDRQKRHSRNHGMYEPRHGSRRRSRSRTRSMSRPRD